MKGEDPTGATRPAGQGSRLVGSQGRAGQRAILLLTCLFVFATTVTASLSPTLRDGDIVFQTSRSDQSDAIRRATHSPYTHMGIIFLEGGRPVVLEAVGPVQWTPLDEWTRRGVGGRYVAKRLADPAPLLKRGSSARLRAAAERFRGRPYDFYFEWSDKRMYCSELVWKAYRNALGIRIGDPERLRDFDWKDPLVAAKLRERYGRAIPWNETVISPARMFDSDKLRTVYEGRRP